jgi:hypothetical protein
MQVSCLVRYKRALAFSIVLMITKVAKTIHSRAPHYTARAYLSSLSDIRFCSALSPNTWLTGSKRRSDGLIARFTKIPLDLAVEIWDPSMPGLDYETSGVQSKEVPGYTRRLDWIQKYARWGAIDLNILQKWIGSGIYIAVCML